MTIYDILGMIVSIKIRWDSLRLKKTTAAGASWWGLMPFCKSLTPKNQWKSALVAAGWCLHNDPSTAPFSEVPTCQGVIKRYQKKAVMMAQHRSYAPRPDEQEAKRRKVEALPAGESLSLWVCLQSPKPALLIVHTWESMLTVLLYEIVTWETAMVNDTLRMWDTYIFVVLHWDIFLHI